MVKQLPHFGHGQIVPVDVTTVCVLLMMGAGDTRNM